MSLIRLLLLCLAVLAATLTVSAQELGPNGPIAARSDAATDADIAVRIREILGELGGYEDVTVTVADGIVTFRGTTTSLAEITALDALAARVEGVVAIRNDVTETSDLRRRLDPVLERFRNRGMQALISLPLVLIAAGAMGMTIWIGYLFARRRNPWDRIAPNAFIADVYRMLVRVAFILAGIVLALDIMNATALLSTILGAAGIVGLAVGFAVRDTVENFIASVLLSIRQPFAPNDVVEINGDQGKVIRLTSRATILLSFDGNHIRIPNATVFKSRIVNFTTNPETRFSFTIPVAAESDLAEVKRLAQATVAALPFTLETPAPSVWLGDITDSGVEVVVTGWVDQRQTSLLLARGEALRQVKHAWSAAGIEMPNTTYTIDLAGGAVSPVTEGTRRRDEAAPAPLPPPDAAVLSEVAERTSEDLDALVDAEREDRANEDLLRRDAPKE
ncbi:mechanosensitive ion channel domain-containing protein [Histidinibacterium lentulum]|uniref:Small-conductance mechanosensitive channel n=1 Tax=Histidinibacterium lentulum TaxID=2480588 RepID=A0A3N2QWC7_9RHOB|nr:mechanosensitive ion channel domain-containing protein [Histidinibacterium lentulum]ROT99472.1 BON domain-containing protein [Histidinibacterium lentulum]